MFFQIVAADTFKLHPIALECRAIEVGTGHEFDGVISESAIFSTTQVPNYKTLPSSTAKLEFFLDNGSCKIGKLGVKNVRTERCLKVFIGQTREIVHSAQVLYVTTGKDQSFDYVNAFTFDYDAASSISYKISCHQVFDKQSEQ